MYRLKSLNSSLEGVNVIILEATLWAGVSVVIFGLYFGLNSDWWRTKTSSWKLQSQCLGQLNLHQSCAFTWQQQTHCWSCPAILELRGKLGDEFSVATSLSYWISFKHHSKSINTDKPCQICDTLKKPFSPISLLFLQTTVLLLL